MASATFAENFFFASLIQVVPIGAIEANNLMLCGNVHFTQGQRQSLSVPFRKLSLGLRGASGSDMSRSDCPF